MEIKLEDCATIPDEELKELLKSCPRCKGAGQITEHGSRWVHHWMKCPECLGTKQDTYQFAIKGKPCDKCGADGRIETWADKEKKDIIDMEFCDKCSGSGFLFFEKIDEHMDVTYKGIPLRVISSGTSGKLKIVRIIRKR